MSSLKYTQVKQHHSIWSCLLSFVLFCIVLITEPVSEDRALQRWGLGGAYFFTFLVCCLELLSAFTLSLAP